jgi:hypothetical protein
MKRIQDKAAILAFAALLGATGCNESKGGGPPVVTASANSTSKSPVSVCGSKLAYGSDSGQESTPAGTMTRINVNAAVAVCGQLGLTGKMPFSAEGMRVAGKPVVQTGSAGASLLDDSTGSHVELNDKGEAFVLSGGKLTKFGDLKVKRADVGITLLPGFSMSITVHGQPYSPDTTQPGDKFAPLSEKAIILTGPGLD